MRIERLPQAAARTGQGLGPASMRGSSSDSDIGLRFGRALLSQYDGEQDEHAHLQELAFPILERGRYCVPADEVVGKIERDQTEFMAFGVVDRLAGQELTGQGAEHQGCRNQRQPIAAEERRRVLRACSCHAVLLARGLARAGADGLGLLGHDDLLRCVGGLPRLRSPRPSARVPRALNISRAILNIVFSSSLAWWSMNSPNTLTRPANSGVRDRPRALRE